MFKTLFLALVVFVPALVSAQDSYKTIGAPFSLPLSIDEKGNLSLFDEGKKNLSLNFNGMAGFIRSSLLYSFPKVEDKFTFSPIDKGNGFVSVRKQRMEAGLGLSALIKSVSTIGLTPYKGATSTITQFKQDKKAKNHSFKLPKRMSDLESWSIGDRGSYETYGGIITYVAISSGIIDISKISVSFQNEFEVEITKLDEKKVALLITEGKVLGRSLRVGPFLTHFTKSRHSKEGVRAEFIFDSTDEHHRELFKKALQGDFVIVADELEKDLQKISWTVDEREFFFGLPMVAGRTNARAHYEMDEDGQTYEVDYKNSRNNGILTAKRVHQKTVFQTEESVALIWSSEMKKVGEGAFQRNFLDIGKALGVPGFDMEFHGGFKFGTLFTQIALDFSKEEFLSMQSLDEEDLKGELRIKCERESLPCKREARLKKIIKKYSSHAKKSWEKSRDQLGLLFTEHPALLATAIKLSGLQKKVYFKFLSEKFQSVEGMAPVGT